MSDDRFDDELRSVIRRAAPRTAPDRLRERVLDATELPARPASRLSRAWPFATGAGAALLVLLVAYGGYQLLGTPPAPTSGALPSPSIASASPAPGGAASLQWSHPGVVPVGFFPMAIVPWHTEYVAVGQMSDGSQTIGGVATSPDGIHWTKVDTGRTFMDIPIRLATTSDHLIAIGNAQLPAGCPQGEGAQCTPAEAAPVWISVDARTWTQVDPGIFGAGYFTALQAGPRGALIEGRTVTGQPELWFSPDGAAWQRVELPAAFGQAEFSDGAVIPGGFVLVGRQNQPAPSTGLARQVGYGLPAAWWSADGLNWQASTVEGAVPNPGAELGPIEVGSDGLLVVGTDNPDGSKAGLAWASTDGRSFHLLGSLAGVVPYSTQEDSDGQHIVKLGPMPTNGPENSDSLAAWVSADGVTWQSLTLLGDRVAMPAGGSGAPTATKAQMQHIFVVGRGLIVIGTQDTAVLSWFAAATWPAAASPSPTPALPSPPPAEATSLWTPVTLPVPPKTGQPVGGPAGGTCALPGGGFIDFVVSAPSLTYVYTSTDGDAWTQRGTVTGSDALGISGPVATNGKVYVALGDESGGGGYYAPQRNGAAWVSSDLVHWTKAPVQLAFGGAEFASIAAGPSGFVAIGFDNGGQAVWFSSDGLHWTVETDGRVFPANYTEPTGIVHTATGFVMVGRIGDKAAAWTSTDGRTWTLHSPLPHGSGIVLSGLAMGRVGLVTLGVGGSQVALAPDDIRSAVAPWISSDGVTWRSQAASAALFGAQAVIVAAPGGYIAAGSVGLEPGADIWTSTDGSTWVRVAGVDLAGASAEKLVSDGRHALFIGRDANGDALVLVSAGVQR